MVEFRIYYESLEQAHDYILPMLTGAMKGVVVNLVKRPRGKEKSALRGKLKGIYNLTTPDILLTGIYADVEYPLVLVEFSEAVTAEDHELQRLNGTVAAYLANCIYLKISGEKGTDKEFGGAEYDIFSTTRIMREQLDYEACIIARWPTQETAPFDLIRDENFRSVPPPLAIVNDIIEKSVKAFVKQHEQWFSDALTQLKQTKSFSALLARSKQAPSLSELLHTWRAREGRNNSKNLAHRTRFFVKDNELDIKIYRWTHAMDPDRGIIIILSAWLSEQRQIFGIYNIERKNKPKLIEGVGAWRVRFLETLETDAGGVPVWFANELRAIAVKVKSLDDEFDGTSLWQQHRNEIEHHSVLSTLFFFTDGVFLGRNGPKLKWNRFAELGAPRSGFLETLRRTKSFDQTSAPLEIEIVKSQVDEDEVTYALVHRLLKPNRFRIIGVSYPGAQGSHAILPDRSEGLSQKRYYPDVVALLPTESERIDVVLEESKGMFSGAQLETALGKLTRYLDNVADRDALKESLIRARVLNPEGELQDILIGVGFGIGLANRTEWQPARVDFIFRIMNREKWAIGIFRQKLKDLIPVIEGETIFPECYRVAPFKPQTVLPGLE